MLRDGFVVLGFRLAWAVVPRLPHRLAVALFDLLADLAWLRNGRGVRRLQGNLARVAGLPVSAPASRALCRRGLRSYARYWRQMFALDPKQAGQIDALLRVEGREHLDAALAEGRGVVLAATHSGNWDVVGAWCARTYGEATAVAERLRPEALFDAFVRARSAFGIEILPHQGGPRPVSQVLQERLRAGGLIGLVCDRDLSRRGVEVQFLGATARMAAGPAALARNTGAALVPVGIWHEGERTVFHIHPALSIAADDDVETITQRIADVFAADIVRHPEDWHMLQRVWVDGMVPR